MSPSSLILDTPASTANNSALSNRAELVAKLNKALYPVDRQEKFLELQAEVDTLFSQLQAISRAER